MIEETAKTDSVSTGRVWLARDSGASLFMDRETVERLKQHILEAFFSIPRRGLEVGGLLLGEIVQTKPIKVHVTDFEPLPCEHRFGPGFVLSDTDQARMHDALSTVRPEGPAVVGCYRSITGRDLGVDSHDESLLKTYFSGTNQVFLFVRPQSASRQDTWFFDGSRGRLPSTPHGPAEPLALMNAASSTEVEVELDPEPVPVPEPSPLSNAWRPVEPAYVERPPRRTWPWVLATLVLIFALGLGYQQWRDKDTPPAAISLDAKRTDAGLEVHWDTASPALRKANRAVLSISENGVEANINLDRAALQAGSHPYKNSGDDVLVRMTAYEGARPTANESLRVMRMIAGLSPPPVEEPKEPPATNDQKPPVEPKEVARPPKVVTAAVPMYQVQPTAPPGIQTRIHTRITVEVQVRIDATGRVISATPLGDGSGLYRYLAARAADTARSWVFQPARSASGEAVMSSKTLTFTFDPAAQRAN